MGQNNEYKPRAPKLAEDMVEFEFSVLVPTYMKGTLR